MLRRAETSLLAVTNSSDDRSPLAQAVAWSSRITTIALEMVLPGILGHWLDRQLGTWLVFLILGTIFGMSVGMMHLIRLTKLPQANEPMEGTGPPDHRQR